MGVYMAHGIIVTLFLIIYVSTSHTLDISWSDPPPPPYPMRCVLYMFALLVNSLTASHCTQATVAAMRVSTHEGLRSCSWRRLTQSQ